MSDRVGQHHYGSERAETIEHKAERTVREELARSGWTENQLRARPKGDPGKLAIARRLREQTTMSVKWITGRLECGTPTYLNRRLYEERRGSLLVEARPLQPQLGF